MPSSGAMDCWCPS